MVMMASGTAARQHQTLKAEGAIMDQGEGVSGVVTVCILEQARQAQIIVLAVSASDHLGLIKL